MNKTQASMSALKVFFLLSAGLIFSLQNAKADDGAYPWQLKKEDEGIRVWVRKVEGSPILEYKAEMNVREPFAKVLALYEDETKMAEWFHQCTSSALIRSESAERKILYFTLAMPWPVSDRDASYLREKSVDAQGTVSYAISALPAEAPAKEGLVRMPYLKGVWRFSPREDGSTDIFVQQHADAGGHIPAVVVNRLVVDIPFNSLKRLRKLLSKTPG